MLSNKESLDQIIVATPGLSSDPIALGVLQDKDLFSVFADPNMLDTLVPAHPALVNAIVLVLHSVAGSTPMPGADSSSRACPPAPTGTCQVASCLKGSLMMRTTFTQVPGPRPQAAPPAPAQLPGVQWSCWAPAHHPERAGHCPGPGQHSGEQLSHADSWYPGPLLRDLPNVLQRPVRDAHHQRSLQPSPAACPAGLGAAQPSEPVAAPAAAAKGHGHPGR